MSNIKTHYQDLVKWTYSFYFCQNCIRCIVHFDLFIREIFFQMLSEGNRLKFRQFSFARKTQHFFSARRHVLWWQQKSRLCFTDNNGFARKDYSVSSLFICGCHPHCKGVVTSQSILEAEFVFDWKINQLMTVSWKEICRHLSSDKLPNGDGFIYCFFFHFFLFLL